METVYLMKLRLVEDTCDSVDVDLDAATTLRVKSSRFASLFQDGAIDSHGRPLVDRTILLGSLYGLEVSA